jgi:hypothetical protein
MMKRIKCPEKFITVTCLIMIDNIYNMFPFMDVNFMGILSIEKVLFKKFSQLNL